MKKVQGNKGITLIALVITIIVLLILAGVSMATLGGENGIIARARKAKTTTEEKQAEEEAVLLVNEYEMYKKMCEAEGKEPNIEEFLEKNYKDKYKVENGKYKIETESGENLEIDDKGNVKLDGEVVKANNVKSIVITGETEVQLDQSILLTVTIGGEGEMYKDIEWSSTDTTKVTVEGEGKTCTVTGVQIGSTSIICKVTNYDGTIISKVHEINVINKNVTTITINGDKTVDIGNSITLTATINPSDATYKSIEWNRNDASKATISFEGTSCTVTGSAVGSVTITCKIINKDDTEVNENYIVSIKNAKLASKVSVGDFVNYNAGNWTSTANLPSTNGNFGGYKSGTSKNLCITPHLNYGNKYSGGWRVLSKNGDTVTIIHAGTPAAYFCAHSASITTLSNNLNNFCNNNFVSTFGVSSKSVVYSDLGNTDITKTGSYYWMASGVPWDQNCLGIVVSDGSRTGADSDYCFGVRPVVILSNSVRTTGKANNGYGQSGWVLVNE